MSEKPQAHRPGLFKLPSKRHKTGQHRSKGAVSRDTKGKLGVKVTSFKASKNLSKSQRKNMVNQIRSRKQEQIQEKERMEGGVNRAPYLTTVISFDSSIDSQKIIERLLRADSEASFSQSKWGRSFHISIKRFKSRYAFVAPSQESLKEVLDCVRVSDCVMIVWPTGGDVSDDQELLMAAMMAMGLPTVVHVICGMPPNGKQREQMRKSLLKLMDRWGMSSEKLHSFDSDVDALQVLRSISTVKKKHTILQKRRPHLLVDALVVEKTESGMCTLKVSGYARGPPLNVNMMVHLQGWGDFKIGQIDVRDASHQTVRAITRSAETSQTASVVDIEMDCSDVEDEGDMDQFAANEISQEDEEEEQMSVSEIDGECSVCLDEEENMKEVEKYRHERENAKWPDEVDTPHDVPARDRFQKYRGLKSFRTSPWDPKENLPDEYGKIYKFSNFKHTKKLVLTGIKKSYGLAQDEGTNYVPTGSYVTLHIVDVPSTICGLLEESVSLVIFAILPHEEKMAVVNMVLQKHSSCKVPIKNKQNLVFQVGYRRFSARPIFSEHTNGNKFKMHRFIPAEGTFCASVFAPVMFTPSTVLVFRIDPKGQERLVATGIVLDLNPDRIVLKRIVLSGHPYRINKRVAVVRYMFFNKEDVEWFKPVEIYTPKGRRGHIKESLGTHGLLKVLFDQALTTQDAVMMNLYKRVFPKWSYNSRVSHAVSSTRLDQVEEKMEE